MVKFDLGSIKRTTVTVALLLAHGEQVTDEDWVEAINHVTPPLLPRPEALALIRLLDPAAERRGRRPPGAPGNQAIIRFLRTLRRNDLPRGFLEGLIGRLEMPKRFTRHNVAVTIHRFRRRQDRRSLIRGLYRAFYEALEGNPKHIDHPILGTLNVPGQLARSDQALNLTSEVLRSRLAMNPPSARRMMNIISGAP